MSSMWSMSVERGFCQRSWVRPPAAYTVRPTTAGGGVRSRTSTLKVLDALLPLASWALQRTVVVPTTKTEPDAGEHVTRAAARERRDLVRVLAGPAVRVRHDGVRDGAVLGRELLDSAC